MRIPRAAPRAAFLVIGAAILLAGCAPSTHPAAGASGHAVTTPKTATSTAAAASSTAKPGPTPNPASTALAANAIIRITTTVTATTGAVAELVETVLAPAPADGSEGAAMSAAGCDGSEWPTEYPHPSWTHVTVAATLLSGASWPSEDPILTFSGGYWGYSAWTGAWGGFEAPCSDGLQGIPGTATGIVPADADAAPLSQASATGGSFGFVWASDADEPSDMHFSFTSCTIEPGPAAGAAAARFTRVPASDGFPIMCSTPQP
ncbi:MAG TPA: hypothetical protein VGM70_08600 [Pseudolysinimonas sp.]|jgi:hypothetical protein